MIFEKFLLILTLITGIFWLINKFSKFINNAKLIAIIDYISDFFIIFLIVLILRSFWIEPYRIPTGSMRPTLVEGDFILVKKYKYGLKLPVIHKKISLFAKNFGSKIQRDEVIIFWQESSQKILIKRVIGLPGDHVVYKNQNLYINNNLIQTVDHGVVIDQGLLTHKKTELLSPKLATKDKSHDIYVNPNYITKYPFDDIVVGKDSYFVMGDNRDHSGDSRFDGLVAEKDILGQAFFTWFSLDWANKLIRFNKICKKIE